MKNCRCGGAPLLKIRARVHGPGSGAREVTEHLCAGHADLIFDVRPADLLAVEFVRPSGGRATS